MAKNFEDFKRLYSLSKTLRFEAKPIGATLDNIVKSGLLDEDEHRAASYVKVKKLIDEYHKVFIDRVLADGCLSPNEDAKKAFEEIQQNLLPAIVLCLLIECLPKTLQYVITTENNRKDIVWFQYSEHDSYLKM